MALKLKLRTSPRNFDLIDWPVVEEGLVDENGVAVTATAPDLNLMTGLGAAGFVVSNTFLRCASGSLDVTGGDSGALGGHGLGIAVPANSIVLGAVIDVSETFTDGDADATTIAISIASAGDIIAAVDIADGGGPWDQGLHAGTPDFTVANAIKTTVAASILATIAEAPLTAGAMTVHIFYIPTVADAA